MPVIQRERLIIEYLIKDLSAAIAADGQDVIDGLTRQPKALPPKYFYDDRGSQLFERITQLPEYYLTRTETQILQQSASAIAQLTGACELVELGSGSSTKTRLLLNAYRQLGYPLHYVPIDVSGGMLETSSRQLLADYPTLNIHGLVGTYDQGLANLPPTHLPTRLLCFLGSTIGNLSPQECDHFLTQVSQALQPGEYFLLGIDLHKSRSLLEAAYNDSEGVTAAFNLNMLHHLNWRFQGNFEVDHFAHEAIYNDRDHQIELYIRSLRSQIVDLKALNLSLYFEAEERILSEISRKFDRATLELILTNHSLQVVDTYTDNNDWFALLLCERQA